MYNTYGAISENKLKANSPLSPAATGVASRATKPTHNQAVMCEGILRVCCSRSLDACFVRGSERPSSLGANLEVFMDYPWVTCMLSVRSSSSGLVRDKPLRRTRGTQNAHTTLELIRTNYIMSKRVAIRNKPIRFVGLASKMSAV